MKLTVNSKQGFAESLKIFDKELLKSPQELFSLVLLKDGERKTLSPKNCKSIRGSGEKLVFDFENMTVETKIHHDGKTVRFGISVDNQTDMYIEKLRYPCLEIKDDLVGNGGSGRLFLPYCEGFLCEKLAEEGKADPKLYPGLINMQFLSYYDENGGIYYACEDEACTPKEIDCKPADGGIELVMDSFIAVAPGEKYENDNYSVLKEFAGDWRDACELYREFTENSGFSLPKKLKDETDLPKGCDDTPLFVIYPVRSIVGVDYFGANEYFPYINGKKYIDDLKSEIGSSVMALLINWEGSAPWCPPFIWPPYGGEKALSEFVSAMHGGGDYVGLYASGINWTDQSKFCPEYNMKDYRLENGIDDILCRKPDGSLDEETCVRSVREGYHMCPACEETKNITYGQTDRIAECGIDYLQYFDQNCGGAPDPCYSGKHGHKPVHGEWSNTEMKKIFSGIVKRMKDCGSNCLIGAESSPSDCFIGELRTNDLRFEWPMSLAPFTGFSEGKSVPAFEYVFHEYSMNFMGNQCIFNTEFPGSQNPESLNLRLAYSFAAGNMLTAVLKSGGEIHFNWGASWIEPGPSQTETKAFLKELCAMRRGAAKKFLLYGRMEKSTVKALETVTLTGKDGKKITYPSVFSSCWSFEGETAVILVNHTRKPQKAILSESFKSSFTNEKISNEPISGSIEIPPLKTIGLIK